MLLAIDASSAAKSVRTGVEQYAFQLIQQFKSHPLAEGDRVRLYTRQALSAPLGTLPAGWETAVLGWRGPGWMRLRVGWETLRRPPDVLFVPAQGLPLFPPRTRGRRTVTTVHDVGFLRAPQLYDPAVARRLRSATARAVRLATRLLTVSEFSKREIMDAYRVAGDRIAVTPLAADPSVFRPRADDEVRRVCDAHRVGAHFFLVVGRQERKKNPLAAVRAFELFKSRRGEGDPLELVLVGAPGFGADDVTRYLQFHPLRARVRLLPYLPEADVAALMSGAAAFLFPSWYEGFGLPVLEAMACGAPVIASDIPACRETAGDAAVFAPPAEAEAWAEAMRRVVESSDLRADLQARGRVRAALFSWGKTAGLTWETLAGT